MTGLRTQEQPATKCSLDKFTVKIDNGVVAKVQKEQEKEKFN